jgi:ABC-type dipeptide/oligopeptide/nickel transport system permease subunit
MSVGAPELLIESEAEVEHLELVPGEIAARSPRQLFWQRFKQDRVAMVSAVFIILLILIAIFAPLVVDLFGLRPPDAQNSNLTNAFGSPTGPTSADPMGVDALGRDIMSRVIYGARVSLEVGIIGTFVAAVVGTVLGLAAGYFGGWPDTVVSRTVDVFLAFPVLVLGLGIGSACAVKACAGGLIQPGIATVIFIIAISSFTYITRIVRGQVLSLREKEFVEAARSLGASNSRILFRELMPNLMAPLIVYSTLLIPLNILLEAALSFLGVGVRAPTPTWGNLISESESYIPGAWWYLVFPGGALLLTVVAFNLFGDGLLDALNPRRGQ